jgi:hypothetical protein
VACHAAAQPPAPPPARVRRQAGRSELLATAGPAGAERLMDGSLSTLAPIFAVVLATHEPITAFFTGLATGLGAGVSMAFSEGLSDTGDLTARAIRSSAGDHRRRHVRRRCLSYVAVPYPCVSPGDRGRGGRRGDRARGARRAARSVLPHEFRELVRVRDGRGRDHRRDELGASASRPVELAGLDDRTEVRPTRPGPHRRSRIGMTCA